MTVARFSRPQPIMSTDDNPQSINIELVNSSPLHYTAELDVLAYSGEHCAIGVGEYDAIYETVYGAPATVCDVPLIVGFGDYPMFPEPTTGIPSRTLAIPTQMAAEMDTSFPVEEATVHIPKEGAAERILRDDDIFFG